jgi:hypothetical protein
VKIESDSTALLGQDMWKNRVRYHHAAELYSYTVRQHITLEQAKRIDNLHVIFQLPMSETAFQQYMSPSSEIEDLIAI